jgi:serine/threonine protein kinase
MNEGPFDHDVEILAEALRLPPAERMEYLDRACSKDTALCRKVQALLEAHEQAGDFLGEPAPGLALTRAGYEKPGDVIGRYTLLRQIGEGGCGVVFMAEQGEPVRRCVALKVVKPGMDTKSVIVRFEVERQALALMDHPSIAHVFDAGTTQHGRPFFVMELLTGIKITDYCDRNSLTASDRLGLFIQVCDAVQHAHQKGVIHRDIKPSNVLVATGADGKAWPKIIDFGIAKAITGLQLTDNTLFTAAEMLIGTPAYMSPEQADLASVDVDTRTDIYSLGVLLYELLTGSRPFDAGQLVKSGLDEIRRVIREQEPVRPSTRLSRMPLADLMAVAQQRRSEPSKLIRAIRRDLDWIVMKALEKDRARRYATANGLAMDVQRYLANETISAGPPSQFYRFRKLVSRNRVIFAGIGTAITFLVISLILVSASFVRERNAHREAQEVKFFLEDMLISVGPSVAAGQDTTMLRGILERTAAHFGAKLKDQPADEAELRTVIGKVYYELNAFDKAEEMYRGALVINRKLFRTESKQAAASLNLLGMALYKIRRLPEAAQAHMEALAIRRRLFGNENLDVAISMNNLAGVYRKMQREEEAEAMILDALRIRRKLLADDDLYTANALENLGLLLDGEKRYAEGEAKEWEALAIRKKLTNPEDLDIAIAYAGLGYTATQQGKWSEAESVLRESHRIRRKLLGDGNPLTMDCLRLMCESLEHQGKYTEAEALHRELLGYWERRAGSDVPEALGQLEALIRDYMGEDKLKEAEQALDKALSPALIQQPSRANLLAVRVDVKARQRRWKEAAADAILVLKLQPENHYRYHTLAPLLVITDNRPAYEQLCREMLAKFGTTKDANVADRTAKDCLLLPQWGVDLTMVSKLADTSINAETNNPSMPFFQACKAMSEYRSGHFGGAIEWAEKPLGTTQNDLRSYVYAILAMAHWQLGEKEQAREMLARGNRLAPPMSSVNGTNDLGYPWGNWLFARISLDEAATLTQLGSKAGDGPK